MKRFFLLVIAGFLFFSCSDTSPKNSKVSTRVDATPELLAHSLEFDQQIYQVTDNVYSAVGFGLANSIMIEGKDGLIIVDTMESMEQAKAVLAGFRQISDKPIKALIYTHNHVDHIMGAQTMAGSDNPEIYAHKTLDSHVQRLVNKMRPIIGTRSMRMFGNYLDDKGLVNSGIGPFLGIGQDTTTGYLSPTQTFSDQMDILVAGVKIRLIHAPGETDDQINVILPDQNLLICGDNFYRSFPNLYTIRGTAFRSLENWYKSVDMIREIRPEYLVPCHGRPLSGGEKILAVLTDYRDAIQYVHDQGIRGINMGMTPDELVAFVRLPQHLAASPYLQEFYGAVSWSLRSLFSGNLGWFSGDAADLNPLSKSQEAALLADLAGGKKNLFSKAAALYQRKEYQAALGLTGHLLTLDSGNRQAKRLRIDALEKLGQKEKNANARHYYLTEAAEIRDDFLAVERVKISRGQLSQFPLEGFFSMLSVSLDPLDSAEMEKTVGIQFKDVDQNFGIYLRRGVAEIRKGIPENPDILARADSTDFKAMLAGIKSPVTTLAGFEYEKGNAVSMGLFFSLFKPPAQKLAHVSVVK